MSSRFNFLRSRYRKIVHFSLILCLLFIQALIAGFFYNEYISQKNLSGIEQKLQNLQALELLTDQSRDSLVTAQGYLQQYIIHKDKNQLKNYFASLNSIAANLRILEKNKGANLKVNEVSLQNSIDAETYKKLIDSTYNSKITEDPPVTPTVYVPKIDKYIMPELNFDEYNAETKVFSDSTRKKKNLFGRIGDAIAGRETIKKDSVVVVLKPGAKANSQKLQAEFDSVVKAAQMHYSRQFERVVVNVEHQQTTVKSDTGFYNIFGSLIDYSNRLIGVYGNAVKSTKADLLAEYERQNSKNNNVRTSLIFASMILMFIVSILILMLTRLAFQYEQKLKGANQQNQENLNFKNRILGMLSHEMRAPLKIVDLFIKRINKKTDNPEIKEHLKSISFTNSSLLIQAEQILEYTKNQYAENQLVPTHFNLNSEIENILIAIQPYVESRHNQFVVEKSIDPSIQVFSDKTKIHQLYLNIIGNANKFTEYGTIVVSASAQQISDSVVTFKTSVKDSGTGILQSDLNKIFEPYYQGVLSGDFENIGAGLGLSLCKEIVGLFSGTIEVSSEINKGTTVSFTINLNRDNANRS